jgi:exonuclease VII large subunit
VLERGYAVVTAGDRVIRDVAQVEIGAELAVRLHIGTLRTRVIAR